MSRPVVRALDFHMGHFCLGTGAGFHATPFITGSLSVFTNKKPTCTMGSVTACGDKAISGNTSVLIGGKPILRTGDATSGHACVEATETFTTFPGAGLDGADLVTKAVDLTCTIDGGYFHPTVAAIGSINVLA